MDPQSFTASLFEWDPTAAAMTSLMEAAPPPPQQLQVAALGGYEVMEGPIIPNNPPPTFSSSYFPSSDFLIQEANDIFFRDHFPQPCDISTSYFESDIATHHSITAQPKNNISGASSSSGESRDKTFKDSVLVERADKGLKKRATTYKGDKHSKVKTTRGLRNRRIRLSVDIARRFFDLQEILGFDKGSKTMEWLFNKSEAEIKNLK